MAENIRNDLAEVRREPVDPIKLARRDLKKALPKRFYADVSVAEVEGGCGLLLDGRPVRTPSKALLRVPTQGLAEALAAEWRAQTEWIEPATMPMTRLANTAIDAVANAMEPTAGEIAKYAESDLVCYRAGTPSTLVEAQAAAWDPILAFAREKHGARFVCAEGVMFVAQPETARDAVLAAVSAIAAGPAGALRLSALSVMTSLTGSVLIALAVAEDAISAQTGWTAAHVDEDYQMQLWGTDAEALERRRLRWADMKAAATVFRLAV